MSFHEVQSLVARVSGQRLACEQTLWNWALQKVVVLDARLAKEVAACQDLAFPEIATSVDLYAADAEEVLVLTDAIGVKAQTPTRDKPGSVPTPKEAKRHDTDVLLLERPGGDFVYLAGSTDKEVSLVQGVDARVRREWGGVKRLYRWWRSPMARQYAWGTCSARRLTSAPAASNTIMTSK